MSEEKDKGDRRIEEFKIELKKMIEKVKKDTEELAQAIFYLRFLCTSGKIHRVIE